MGGYAYNAGINHGATFGAGYQTYFPAKTDDPDGPNYFPSNIGLKGFNEIRELCPVTCDACPASTAARKDPHLWFAHGGKADFRGEDGAVYNLLSTKNLSMNVAIKYTDTHANALEGNLPAADTPPRLVPTGAPPPPNAPPVHVGNHTFASVTRPCAASVQVC